MRTVSSVITQDSATALIETPNKAPPSQCERYQERGGDVPGPFEQQAVW